MSSSDQDDHAAVVEPQPQLGKDNGAFQSDEAAAPAGNEAPKLVGIALAEETGPIKSGLTTTRKDPANQSLDAKEDPNMSDLNNNRSPNNQVKYASVASSPEEAAKNESFNLIIDDSVKSPGDKQRLEDKRKRPRFPLRRGKKSDAAKPPSDEKDVTSLQLFRYSDCWDKLMIFVGIIAAFLAAGIYPLMFLMYGQVAGTLVDYQKYRIMNGEAGNLTLPSFLDPNSSNSTGICYKLSKMDTNFDARIAFSIRFYLSVGAVSILVNYLAHVCFNTSSERQIKRIRNKLFESLVRQEMAFFDKNTPGELNSVLTSNLSLIQLGIGYKVGDFISMFGRGLGCSLLALISAWKFSVVFLGITPVIVFTTMMTVLMIKKYTVLEFKAYGSAGKVAQEVLSSIRTVVSLGMQKKSVKTYEESLLVAENMASKKGFLTGLFGGLSTGLFNLCFAVGIYYATYLASTDCENYNAGNLMLSFFSIVTTTFSIGQALPYLRDLSEARGAAKKVYHIIEKKSQIDVFTSKGVNNVDIKGSIEFEDVLFSYPQRPGVQILKGLNLKIPAGKTVALCGSSGGGKSTVIGLLQRFYLQSSGNIKIDGRNIDDYELAWLRSQMALVSQEPILFSTTIRENIRLGRLDATDAEIEEAAKNANAHNFIMSCTKQYDTPVGERGAQLSGGQKQRIAIARALLRNPKILLLDEATSALDYESERTVQEALDRAKVGRTTIVIAHRLSTIRNADLIIGLVNGQVAEVGTHEELMEHKGVYYELVTLQTNQPKDEELDDDIMSERSFQRSDSKMSSKFNRQISTRSKLSRQSSKLSDEVLEVDFVEPTIVKKKFMYLERFLFKYHLPELMWLFIGCAAQAVNGAIFPGQALIFSEIYRIFTIPDPVEQRKTSLMFMGILMGLATIGMISNISYQYAFSVAGARLTKRVRVKMLEAMLRQEMSFHDADENRSSVLSTKLAASAPFCKGLTSDKLSLLSQGCAGVGLAVIVALIISWKLCLVMLVFVPITFGCGVFLGRSATNTKVKGKLAVEEGGRLTTEVIENIKTVVSLGREEYFLEEFESVFNTKFRKTLALLHLQAFLYAVSNSILFFIQAAAFSYGYRLVSQENLAVSSVYKVYATITFSSMILGRVYAQMPDQRKARSAAKDAYRIVNRQSKIDSLSEEGLRPEKVIGDIRFINVHFNYPQRPSLKILRGLNLSVKHDETNALVGPSGCGKSTTIALLLRFYDVTSGSVTLDGVDIRKLNIQWLRSKIGLVSQEPVLFNFSIKENIMFGDCSRNDIAMSEIIDVCMQSNISSKIENLPDKYETIVGTKGGQLSGGEKQRVAIARALIRKPKILLLDEATSALDTQSEQIVQETLDKAERGRTCIVIAHRLSTIQNAHKISVIKDGQVLEEGSHSQLMNNKAFYFNLQNHKNSLA